MTNENFPFEAWDKHTTEELESYRTDFWKAIPKCEEAGSFACAKLCQNKLNEIEKELIKRKATNSGYYATTFGELKEGQIILEPNTRHEFILIWLKKVSNSYSGKEYICFYGVPTIAKCNEDLPPAMQCATVFYYLATSPVLALNRETTAARFTCREMTEHYPTVIPSHWNYVNTRTNQTLRLTHYDRLNLVVTAIWDYGTLNMKIEPAQNFAQLINEMANSNEWVLVIGNNTLKI